MTEQTLQAIQQQLRLQLTEVTEAAGLEADILLSYVLECPRSYLFSWPEQKLSIEQTQRLAQLVARRRQGEPMAYLLGQCEFWSLMLHVSPDVLIPRGDTECLVEAVLALDLPVDARVADLGTGSGAIALALASERPHWQLSVTDVSTQALTLAQANGNRLGLSNLEYVQGDWLQPLPHRDYALIVSNPPYIDAEDPHLSQNGLPYEPQQALVAAEQGYADLVHLISQAPSYLTRGGWLALEHGYQQADKVQTYFKQSGYQQVSSGRDLNGHQRYTLGQYLGPHDG